MTIPLLIACLLGSPATPGHPGPESRADYAISAGLEPDSARLTGEVTIVFSTEVPGVTIDTLWLHLYPNAYRDATTAFAGDLDARASWDFRSSPDEDKGWIDLHDWELDGAPIEPVIDGTLAWIALEEPLEAGDTVRLEGGFEVRVPEVWSRMGRVGESYAMTQWYPKMCAYDELGWHSSRYHAAGEFYSDFGDYEILLDLPVEYVVVATGAMDTLITCPDSTRRIERWIASNVHDFAWMAAPGVTIRDHLFVYPDSLGGDSVRVHLALLSDDPEYWSDVPAIADSTLLYYGEWYAPYAYDDLWIADCSSIGFAGMEYPQLVQVGKGIPFFRIREMVVMHEIGHQWFYAMLANDEVDEAWLDEGMNTFSELRYFDRRYGHADNLTTTPGWLAGISNTDQKEMTYSSYALEGETVPVLSRATDAGDGSYSTSAVYYAKPALFLRMIRRQAGDEAFDETMHLFFDRFAFSHPHTGDFRAILEEVTGRSWEAEFHFWLEETASIDPRAAGLEPTGGGNDSTMVVVECDDLRHDLTVDVLLISRNGSDSLLTEAFLSPAEPADTLLIAGSDWRRAIVDPFQLVPDRVPWNNSLPARNVFRPLFLPLPGPRTCTTYALLLPAWSGESWQLAATSVTSAWPPSLGGPGQIIAAAAVPLEDTGQRGSWSLALETVHGRSPHGSTVSTAEAFSRDGVYRMGMRLDHRTCGRVRAEPCLSLSGGMHWFGIRPWTPLDVERDVEPGDGLEVTGGLGIRDPGYDVWWTGSVECLASPGYGGSGGFARLDMEANLAVRLGSRYPFHTRLYAGGVEGDAPLHRRLRPGGGMFRTGASSILFPGQGGLSPCEHCLIRTGPAMPGYAELDERFGTGVSIRQRLNAPIDLPLSSGVFLFGGVAALSPDGSLRKPLGSYELLADAGIGVRLPFMEWVFPFWVSDPPVEDGEPLGFRWRIMFGGTGLTDLFL